MIAGSEQLDRFLSSIPSGSNVWVEGGHFTPSVRLLQWSMSHGDLPAGGPGEDLLFILETRKRVNTDLAVATRSAPTKTHPFHGVAIRCRSDEIGVLAEDPDTCGCMMTSSRVSATQENTLVEAIEVCQYLRQRNFYPTLAILIGDLSIPYWIRGRLSWILPERYREILERYGIGLLDVELISETYCRNQGKRRILDKRKKEFLNLRRQKEILSGYGYTVIRNPQTDAFYMTSEYILDNYRSPPFAIGLTTEDQMPTCVLILAGKCSVIGKRGFDSAVLIYDTRDDDRIHRKNTDGVVAASYLVPSLEIRVSVNTINGGASRKQDFRTSSIYSRDVRQPGNLTLEALLEVTRQRNNLPNLELASLFTDKCGDECTQDFLE